MLPSRRKWRPNLRRECRAHDSSGCRPGCYGPGVSGGALHAARPVPGSQVRLGGNVRVVEAAAGIHNHKQAVMLYSSRGRFRPASHCFLSPQIRDTVNLETAASGPSASVNAASTSRVDKPRANPTMIRPPARWSWCMPNEDLADPEGNLRRCHLHAAETTLECSRLITAVRSEGLTHTRTATLTFTRIRTTSRRPGMLVHVARRGGMWMEPRHQHGYPNPSLISTAKEHVGGKAHESSVRHHGCSSMWPNMRTMRQMRRGQAKELAYGFAQAVGGTSVPIEADSSADPGEISQFVTPLLDGSGFRQENPVRRGCRV